MEREVTGYPGLSVEEDSVDDLCLSSEDDKKRITGVILGEERESKREKEREREYMYVYIFCYSGSGKMVPCSCVVVATGTFLRGEIQIG